MNTESEPRYTYKQIKDHADDDMGLFDGDVQELLRRLHRSAWQRRQLLKRLSKWPHNPGLQESSTHKESSHV